MSILGTVASVPQDVLDAVTKKDPNGSFLKQMQAQDAQQLGFQLGLSQQQNAFNDTMQSASESAHENAALQTFSQDIASARNTLSSSDMQQIK